MNSFKAPLVLSPTFSGKIKVLAFDLFMWIQLLVLMLVCLILWPICHYQKKFANSDKLINGFIALLYKIANKY